MQESSHSSCTAEANDLAGWLAGWRICADGAHVSLSLGSGYQAFFSSHHHFCPLDRELGSRETIRMSALLSI